MKLFMPKEIFGKYVDNYIEEFSQRYNQKPDYSNKCLCEINCNGIRRINHLLVHPHQEDYRCYERIKRIISRNPKVGFSLFAMGGKGENRVNAIGNFPNLKILRKIEDLDDLFLK